MVPRQRGTLLLRNRELLELLHCLHGGLPLLASLRLIIYDATGHRIDGGDVGEAMKEWAAEWLPRGFLLYSNAGVSREWQSTGRRMS